MKLIQNKKNNLFDFLYNNYLNNKKNILISGGSSIKAILKIAINKKYSLKTNFILADERLVKLNSRLRNDLFFKKLIKKKIIKKKNFINYNYNNYNLKKIISLNNKISKLKIDTCLLGLGSNGHIASVFDLNEREKKNFYLIGNSPKIPRSRVTIALTNIKKCKNIIIVSSKKNKMKEIKNISKNLLLKNILNKITLLIY